MYCSKKLLCTVKHSRDCPVEINEVSWNVKIEPQLDIRTWSPDHARKTKGIGLTNHEAILIVSILLKALIGREIFSQEDSAKLAVVLPVLDKYLDNAELEALHDAN